MNKIIIIPDSFKGTMSSQTVCHVMRDAVLQHYPAAEVVALPVADGGEGSVDCFLEAYAGSGATANAGSPDGPQKKYLPVQGVFGEEVQGYYGLLGDTAVLEMACCAGLPLAEGRLDPLRATTYGVGQLLLAAAGEGVKRIILGLGGSATNDAGCGAAAATGVRFFDGAGREFLPTGGTLKDIAHIDLARLDAALQGIEITAMCDIDNPMHGPNGAAHVFGPQKGADEQTVALLDEGLRHLDEVLQAELGLDIARMPGVGAAGAMGAGAVAFWQAGLKMGIDTVLDMLDFESLLQGADMVFTGEGRIDSQSLRGKVVVGVARRAKAAGVPVVAVVGGIGEGIQPAYSEGVSAIFSINTQPMAFEQSRQHSEQNLAITMDNIVRLLKAREG